MQQTALPLPIAKVFSSPEAFEAVDDPFRRRVYRVVFALAGAYNLAFGLWAGLFPLAFFRWFALEPPRYPSLWACLGMVVGVYGFLYLHAARRLDHAWPIIAIGLLGKVLTSVFANGFYTAAGIMLTVATPALPRPVKALAWIVWTAGIALTVFGAAGSATGLVAASGVLFPALVLLCLAVGRILR